jgi:hypothetical protein
MRAHLRLVALALAVCLLAACGGASQATSGGSNASVKITEPSGAARVRVPFHIGISASVPLGAPETGDHHVHVFYDGNSDDYKVVTGDGLDASGLTPGKHSITASLRNADHSDAGSEDTITVTVVGGSGKTKDSGGDGGYSY